MTDLLAEIIDAHGGLDRWRSLSSFSGHMSAGGPLFERVGQADGLDDINFEGSCREQRMEQWPIARGGARSEIVPDRATLRGEEGETMAERADPERGYPADMAQGWSDLDLAYFAGYAMWNYLTVPFIWTWPGIETVPLDPVDVDGGTFRRLLVRYPAGMMTHSREETFYVSAAGLIVRVDYAPRVTGDRPAANYASRHREVEGGLIMPMRRVVRSRRPDGTADETALITVDIDRLEYA